MVPFIVKRTISSKMQKANLKNGGRDGPNTLGGKGGGVGKLEYDMLE